MVTEVRTIAEKIIDDKLAFHNKQQDRMETLLEKLEEAIKATNAKIDDVIRNMNRDNK
jgi:S-adenosylmethionine/arginine decarboxylase-like enzyme